MPLWLAYSGGLDSTVLLYACRQADIPVRAVHVNHHLQSAAAAMQAHCEDWCTRHDVPLDVLHVSVDKPGGESLEAQARQARYQAIGDHVRKSGAASVVLTAHHRDDQLETVLIALLRGSGLEGLAGMSALSPWPLESPSLEASIWLGRPFLEVSRAQLMQTAQDAGLDWFDDPTNADLSLRRNWLRQEGLPLLRQQFPQVDASLLRLARQVADARDEWHEEAAELLSRCSEKAGYLQREVWAGLTGRQQIRVLRLWLAQSALRLNEVQTLELVEQLHRPQGGVRRVTGGWGIEIRSGVMRIIRD